MTSLHAYAAAPAIFAVATVFSMLGMGGSQLYIPILFWTGLDFKTQAIPLGLLLNVTTSISAAFTYATSRLVNWRVALPFAVAMLTFPALGAQVNARLHTRTIIYSFAAFTTAAALLMLSGWRPTRRALPPWLHVAIGLIGGSALGFMVGLVGRGGGSFVVPLLYICGLEPKIAAATSSVIVTGSATVGFLSHLPNAKLALGPSLACVAAAAAGSQLGSRFMAKKLAGRPLRIIFAAVLLTVAAILFIQASHMP